MHVHSCPYHARLLPTKFYVQPRLMEAAVWSCARWADTYLLAAKPASPGLSAAFGRDGSGPAVVGALMHIANTCLSQ